MALRLKRQNFDLEDKPSISAFGLGLSRSALALITRA